MVDKPGTAVETPEVDESPLEQDDAAPHQPAPDYPIEMAINGVPVENLFRVEGTKGKGAGVITWLLKLPLNVPNPFANLTKIVSPENFFRVVYDDVVKPACRYATKEALDEETGNYSVTKYAEALVAYFRHEKRDGGGIRELRKKFETMSRELMPFIHAQFNPDEAKNWSEEQVKKYQVMFVEWVDISAKLGEDKPKKATKKAAKTAPAPQQKAA